LTSSNLEADGTTDAVETIDYPLIEAIELARRTGGGKWLPEEFGGGKVQRAAMSVSPVRMRTAWSIVRAKILPSPMPRTLTPEWCNLSLSCTKT
jgi:hypothetical protein